MGWKEREWFLGGHAPALFDRSGNIGPTAWSDARIAGEISAVQAMAGPSAGPNGGEIYIDGFTGGRMPPKESIREVRVNQNPFNAENAGIGFGRIDIFTKPGMDKFRTSTFFNFGDESLNSRNPFAPARAPFGPKQRMRSNGNIEIQIAGRAAIGANRTFA